jgi:hypothetical protein
MQKIEFAEASTITRLFEIQLDNLLNEDETAYQVNKDYRCGIMDPVREVAKHEIQEAIKKKVIKQKVSK